MASGADWRITWAVEYIHQHLEHPLNVRALAALVNLSPSRFRDLFGAQTGIGPLQYLQRMRLRRARLLLERTFLSVKEVMALVGYNDPSHFSREFRREHGVTPSMVRGGGVASELPSSPVSSVESPTFRRKRQRRPREPGRRCA